MDRYREDRDRDRERDRDRDRDRYRDRGRFGASNPDLHQYRRPSRFSDGPPIENQRSLGNFRSGLSGGPRGGGGQHPFESPPRHHPIPAAGGAAGFGPVGGDGVGGHGGFRPMEGGYNSGFQLPLSGQKRGFPFSGHGDPPEHYDGSRFVKLFVGSVPRTVTEADVRPVFEEHGKVIEVAFIKDKRSGQQQGCCFIKYATSEEADRAIKALHNQYTLPGGVGPIQVRYADGERERLGNVEYKLFVGSLNKQATELEVKEIFAPYGRIEDVYLMRDERKQSRGCGFVKFSNRDSAMEAINSLNGIYTMRGCDRPLIVRFAEPKRPGAGEPRPAAGPNFSDPMGAQRPRSAWQPITPPSLGPSPNASFHGFGGQLPPRTGDTAVQPTLVSGIQSGSLGGHPDRLLPARAVSSSPGSTQSVNHLPPQSLPAGRQISPLQKPLRSPQHLPSSSHIQPQGPVSYSQTATQSSNKQPGQIQSPPGGQSSFGPGQQIPNLSGKVPPQLQVQHSSSFAAGQPTPLNSNARPNIVSTMAQPPQLSASVQQQLPLQQSSSQLAQMLTHQTQALQARFQSSQQAFSQIQQQLQMMQPSGQNQIMQPSGQNPMMQPSGQNPMMQSSGQNPVMQPSGQNPVMQPSGQNPMMHPSGQHQQLQQNFQGTKQQWAGIVPQTAATAPGVASGTDVTSTSEGPVAPPTAPTVGPRKCNWTEHTSPDGFKYYYNSISGQSTWVKPEELTLYEQQQQKSLSQQPQTQSNLQAPTAQQVPQNPATQPQTQFRQHEQIHYPPITSSYQTGGAFGNNNVQEFKYPHAHPAPGSVNEPARFQQALQGAQDWTWKNKTGGT